MTDDALSNPALGIRSKALVHAAATGGELFRAEVFVDPGGNAGPMHIHRNQEERFELVSGSIAYRRGRERGTANAGEVLVIPPNTGHTFVNAGDDVAHFIAEFRPALRVEEFFAALFALRTDKPDPLVVAQLMREFPAEFFYVPHVPVAVQQALAVPLAAVGRVLGRRAPQPAVA